MLRRKRMEEDTPPWWVWLYLIILFLSLLKAFRALPDPECIEIIASIGAAAGFGWIFTLLYKIQGRLAAVEVQLQNLIEDLNDLKERVKSLEKATRSLEELRDRGS